MIPSLSLPLRDYVYLAAIVAIALSLAWCHHTAVLKGEARVRAADDHAVVLAQRAVEAQKLVDARTAEKTTHDLQTELAALRAAAAKPPPVVRLCVTPARRPVSSPPQPPGGTPSPTTAPREFPSVPAGTGERLDIGPSVQQLAQAGDVLAARERACLAWAQGIAK